MVSKPHLVLLKAPPPLRASEPPVTGLSAVFRRYSPYVARIALRLLGRYDDVDDVVQDVFMDAIKGISALRDPDAIKGWLAAVTTRVAGRRLRLRRLQRWLGLDAAPHLDGMEAPGATPEERALLACVYNVLNQVPVAARMAWILRHVEGDQLETIAATCGCSLSTVKRRIAAAQQHLDEALGHD